MQENAVEFRHISMEFPGVLANDDVSLDIRKGEVVEHVRADGAATATRAPFGRLEGIDGCSRRYCIGPSCLSEHVSPSPW